ncbi:MAG: HYR domain-containing protein [Saprospiraceae bacterium]
MKKLFKTRFEKFILYFYSAFLILSSSPNIFAQTGQIKDCNGKDIITQITVRSSNNQNLNLSNCTFTQGKLSDYLNCVKVNNPTLPNSANLIVNLTGSLASGINGTDLNLIKGEILKVGKLSNACNYIGADSNNDGKINTKDHCILRNHILSTAILNPLWKFYKSDNLNLTGIDSRTDLIFPVNALPIASVNIIGIQNGNVDQSTTSNDTCVLLCQPRLSITPGMNEVRKLSPEFFILNKNCNFSDLDLKITNTAGQIVESEITEKEQGIYFAQVQLANTSQICTTQLSVLPCETRVNLEISQTNTNDSTFVDVIVKDAQLVSGYQMSFKFDPTKLNFSSIQKADENGFSTSNDAYFDGSSHVNVSRYNPSGTLSLAYGQKLFRLKFSRTSSTLSNVIINPENVETLFFNEGKNDVCVDIKYLNDINSPGCLTDTIKITGDNSLGYGIVKFTDYASDDFGTVSFENGVNELDFPISNVDTFDCGTNLLTYITFKDANGQLKQCVFRVIVECPSEICDNKYLFFDGINDRINIPNQHTGNVDFTLECLFLSKNDKDSPSAFHRIFTIGGSTTATRLELSDKDSLIHLYVGTATYLGNVNIRDNQWHHIVLIKEGTRLKVYLDGSLTINILKDITDLSTLRIAHFNNQSFNLIPETLWKGGIDEIKLWNYPLSQEEINNSKNKINTKKKDCGLIGYWRMEEGVPAGNNQTITSIRDSVGINHGTLVGFNLVGDTSNFVCNENIQLTFDDSECCNGESPIFQNCPSGIIGYANANCTASVQFEIPVALDPCTNSNGQVQCFRSDDRPLNAPYSLEKTDVLCIAIGSNSLRDTCSFQVEIRDTTKPVCIGKTLNKIINTNGNASFTAIELNDNSSDNCSDLMFTASKTMFICPDIGQTQTVTLTVTDESGNASSCPVEVKLTDPNNYCACLNDVTKPVCKTKNISLYLDPSGKANLTPAMINDGSFDACSAITLQIEGALSFDCNSLGKQSVSLLVTDVAKNTSFCQADVTVLDTIKPTCIIQPKTFYLGVNGQSTVIQNQLIITPTDNCSGSTTSFNQVNFSCVDLGSKTISATVRDLAGNTSACSTQITIRDTIRPTCNIQPQTIYLGTNGSAILTQSQLNINAIDNCAGIIKTTFNTVNYNCSDIGIKTISASIQDVAGNSNFCTTPITIKDTIQPTCIIRDTIISATDGIGAFVNFNGRAIDNCNNTTIKYSLPSGQFYNCGDYNITMTATDAAGNFSTCTFKLTVTGCDGCCKSESVFMSNTSVDFNLSSDPLSKDECNIRFVTPSLSACQKVTEINWGDGTVSRGSFTNAVDFTHQYKEPAIYEVCVIYEEANQQNCFINKKCNTFEVLNNCSLKRSSLEKDYNKIVLIPNPTNHSFGVSAGATFTHYAIYDQLGKELVSKRTIENTNDISRLQNGVYFVRLYVGSVIITKPIIKIQ